MPHLSAEQITGLKQQLLDGKQALTTLLANTENTVDIVTLDQTKVGRLSRMDALQQQAMAQANRATHQQQLKQVETALAAIKRGDYGFCEECGDDIPFERLNARPESAYCITCQTKAEAP